MNYGISLYGSTDKSLEVLRATSVFYSELPPDLWKQKWLIANLCDSQTELIKMGVYFINIWFVW